MNNKELIPHLFRTEFSKIVSVLCKTFGLSNIELAEDIVSDTFLAATESWRVRGNPDNPKAWLYAVAKSKSKDYFKRDSLFRDKIAPEIKNDSMEHKDYEIDLSDNNIKDSQLQMLFALCDPIISSEAQVAMALRILCGFGIEEISQAFLTTKSTINKRLQRSKKTFREENIKLVFPSENELEKRLSNVLSIIYLLFNEGYFSISSDEKIKKDLCYEAMRLLNILINNPSTNNPQCNALMALFCFHTSRFEARINESGESVLYADQNRDDWNVELINQGELFLNKAAVEGVITKYHLEAVIAFWHTRKKDTKEKWESILQLYNRLLQIEYSPVAALNRTYVLSKIYGKKKAIEEALKINLENNFLYHSLLAELYSSENKKKQIRHLEIAISLAPNPNDKKVLFDKLNAI
ncbi:MAG: RNA polymerase sigma factor (sigma-70 family) [Patiriisocius sp.]|jgi:RNA polymerase sigma factor (sigma-70 family)